MCRFGRFFTPILISISTIFRQEMKSLFPAESYPERGCRLTNKEASPIMKSNLYLIQGVPGSGRLRNVQTKKGRTCYESAGQAGEKIWTLCDSQSDVLYHDSVRAGICYYYFCTSVLSAVPVPGSHDDPAGPDLENHYFYHLSAQHGAVLFSDQYVPVLFHRPDTGSSVGRLPV